MSAVRQSSVPCGNAICPPMSVLESHIRPSTRIISIIFCNSRMTSSLLIIRRRLQSQRFRIRTRPYLQSHTRSRKWQQCVVVVVDDSPEVGGVEVEAIGAAIEVAPEAEIQTQTQAVPEVAAEPATMVPVSTKVPSPLICPQESGRGARCISAGGSRLSSARSPTPVPGGTSSPPSLQRIERMASSVTKK